MRVTREEMLMDVARAVSRRGTCSRKQVGAVVAREGRVLVTGYNGSPAGMAHCEHEILTGEELIARRIGDQDEPGFKMPWHPHKEYYLTDIAGTITVTSELKTCPASVHAEANAVAFAARHGIRLEGGELYTTCSPCLPCAQIIINAGVRSVICGEQYRATEGLELLRYVGVQVGILH